MADNDLNDMMLFIAVVDAGSFTLAAERLNMPKANLSRKIARLEASLGITLLERTTRRQKITEAGRCYLTRCRRIQQEAELAKGEIAAMLNQVSGTLKVGASVGIGHEVLKTELAEFMRAYPEVQIQLQLLNRRVDLIEEGFDLVIRIGELADSRLIAKRLGQISRKLYASPSYLQQHDTISSVEQLKQHDFLYMSSAQQNFNLSLVSGAQAFECEITPKVQLDDYTILKHLVMEGLGLAVIPDYMCQQALEQQQLVSVLPQWGMPSVNIYAVYPKNRLKIPKVQAFMTFIEQTFANKLCR